MFAIGAVFHVQIAALNGAGALIEQRFGNCREAPILFAALVTAPQLLSVAEFTLQKECTQALWVVAGHRYGALPERAVLVEPHVHG